MPQSFIGAKQCTASVSLGSISCQLSHLRPLRPGLIERRSNQTCLLTVRVTRQLVTTHAWTQVIDQASGKPYYWNTATNETAWEIPETPAAPASSPSPSTSTTTSSSSSEASCAAPQQPEPKLSSEALFNVLAAAYQADGTGMQFWEVARAHREHGVFEPPFFDFLEQQQKVAAAADEKELAFKMMCRLSNPLLRQPAPFEM